MNAFAFKVIDAINREGIGNEAWGLVEEVDDTVAYFGTREEIELKGQWAYVYADKNDFFGYIDKVEIASCCFTNSIKKPFGRL